MTDAPDAIATADARDRQREARASILHLVDLKRDGWSPCFTELRVDRRDRIIAEPQRRPAPTKGGRSRR